MSGTQPQSPTRKGKGACMKVYGKYFPVEIEPQTLERKGKKIG